MCLPRCMGGKGQASGSDYEADAFAYISAHILAAKALPWFSDTADIPVAVWLQKGADSPGDDFVVELTNGNSTTKSSPGESAPFCNQTATGMSAVSLNQGSALAARMCALMYANASAS